MLNGKPLAIVPGCAVSLLDTCIAEGMSLKMILVQFPEEENLRYLKTVLDRVFHCLTPGGVAILCHQSAILGRDGGLYRQKVTSVCGASKLKEHAYRVFTSGQGQEFAISLLRKSGGKKTEKTEWECQPAVTILPGTNHARYHSLIREMVQSFTSPGDIVLDVFGGSFEAGIVVLESHRRYIGTTMNGDGFIVGATALLKYWKQYRQYLLNHMLSDPPSVELDAEIVQYAQTVEKAEPKRLPRKKKEAPVEPQ